MNAPAADQPTAPRLRLFLSCAEATRLSSAALDRPLGRAERVVLGLHLAVCRWCRRYRRQLVLLREICRYQARTVFTVTTPALSPATRARLKQRLLDSA